MARFSKLLVAVDGFGPADAATALALDLAAESHAEVDFCFVVNRDRLTADASASFMLDASSLLLRVRSAGETVLDVARTKADFRGVQARFELIEGDPVKMIIERSVALGASAIVMGTHGRRGLDKLVLGSTAEGVLRASTIPVIVVRLATTF